MVFISCLGSFPTGTGSSTASMNRKCTTREKGPKPQAAAASSWPGQVLCSSSLHAHCHFPFPSVFKPQCVHSCSRRQHSQIPLQEVCALPAVCWEVLFMHWSNWGLKGRRSICGCGKDYCWNKAGSKCTTESWEHLSLSTAAGEMWC